MTEFVKIERAELERLRGIVAAAAAFAERVEQAGAAPAIARLLNKAPRTKAGR